MSNWDDDDWEVEKPNASKDAGFDWDAEEEVVDDWSVQATPEPEPVKAAPVAKAAPKAAPKAAAGKKLSLKDALKLKEEEEARARAAAPPMTKEEERRAMEESNNSVTADLFGGCNKPSDEKSVQGRDTNQSRAAALAASSGLADGYDGADDGSAPEAKAAPGAAPSVLDAINLDNKDHIEQFVKELSTKVNNYNNSANAMLLLKEIIHSICPNMKLDHISEIYRVVTVQKNTAADKERNVKKKSNKKPVLAKDRESDMYGDYM